MAAQELRPLFGGLSILAKAEGELEPLFGGRSSSEPEVDSCSVRRQLYGAAGAFLVNLGCTTNSSSSGLSDAPTLMTGSS